MCDSIADALSLKRLQEIDLALLQMQEELKGLPAYHALKKAQARMKSIASVKSNLLGRRKDAEMHLNELREKRTHNDADIERQKENLKNNASNHRVIQDAERSLSNLAKTQDKIDYAYAQTKDELSKIEADEHKTHIQEDVLEKEIAALNKAISDKTTTMQEEVRRLRIERKTCVDGLDEEVYKHYVQASKDFNGLAVETLKDNKPSICRVVLQPSALATLREDESLIQTCPYCRRILIVQDPPISTSSPTR